MITDDHGNKHGKRKKDRRYGRNVTQDTVNQLIAKLDAALVERDQMKRERDHYRSRRTELENERREVKAKQPESIEQVIDSNYSYAPLKFDFNQYHETGARSAPNPHISEEDEDENPSNVDPTMGD